jgi:hypothetical protein
MSASPITPALIMRVSERLALGMPLRIALAGEPVTRAEYKDYLLAHPELAGLQDVAKQKFLESAFDVLLDGETAAANYRWLIELIYKGVIGYDEDAQQEKERLHEKWGENQNHSPCQSMTDAIVDPKSLNDLITHPPIFKRAGAAGTKAFCDFAWNNGDGDENVLALRDGNVITLEETFRAGDLQTICETFVAAFKRLGLQPWQIDGDEGGGGKLICDRLGEMGWPINRVNNGAAPRHNQQYANLAAEMWFEGAKQIARREIILPNDGDLLAQILNRKRVPNAQGKLAIESKTEMKKRGVHSPDRADAIFGAMTPCNHST